MWDELYPNTNPQYNSLASFTPWVQAPNSAHILWKRLGAVAGLIGGPAGQFGTTSSPGSPSLIYAGRCYQTMTVPINGVLTSCAVCYDLRTGEQYYANPTAAPTNGTTPNLVAYVNPVASSTTIAGQELGSSTWSVELLSISGSSLLKVNPLTGALTGNYSIAPLSGGTFHNQIGGYVLNIQDLGAAAGALRYRLINWTTRGTLANLTTSTGTRIISNTTYAMSSLPSEIDYTEDMGAHVSNSIGLGPWGTSIITSAQTSYGLWTINIAIYKLSTGALQYNISISDYPDILYQGTDTNILEHGKIAVWTQGGYYIIIDAFTGKWFRSEVSDYPWSSAGFGAYAVSSGYGMVFRYAYDGVYAYNWTDGKIVWKYKAPAGAPFETPYIDENGNTVYSFNSGGYIADGKLYVANSEHTTTWPITRGWGLHCINITTGELIWKINNPISFGAVADGYLVASNSWDGYMYVFGKGKSATTVTASPKTIAKGADVLIEGTVLDQSPAQPGTACVSKDSMSQQMEYLHLQQQIGGIWNNETITGVPVALTAIGSNGTVINLGTVTSNGYSGAFSLTWTPPAEDKYEIIASFGADDSYGSSMSTTTVSVGPAPTPITFPEQIAPSDYTMTIIGAAVAIIIAVAIVGLLIFLALRKR